MTVTGQVEGRAEAAPAAVIEWDNTVDKTWSEGFVRVEIPSSVDGVGQKAMFHKSANAGRPLVVSLHTWGGDYAQSDPLAPIAVERDVNFMHPDFRGPNRTPDAMGSGKVIADIADAIRYALREAEADPEDVHIVGVSGGGYATLLCYMLLEDVPVRSFSAWAPISDVGAWYMESVGRKQHYAKDVVACLGGEFDAEEAARRSPLLLPVPGAKRDGAKVFLYEGVHDGYTGSVPITQTLHMYNRLVAEAKHGVRERAEIAAVAVSDGDLIAESEMLDLVVRRMNPLADGAAMVLGRAIHLQRAWGPYSVMIFEGGHQQLTGAMDLIPFRTKGMGDER